MDDDSIQPERALRQPHAARPVRAMKVGLVFILAFVAILPSILMGPGIFDEGFIVAGGKLVLTGQLPYRDFFSLYGPAQYYIVAGLFALFGEDLIVSRIAHVAFIAALAASIYALSNTAGRGFCRLPSLVAALCVIAGLLFLPNAGYPAIGATLLLLLGAALIGRWASHSDRRDLLMMSVTVGFAATFRWDFGLVGLIAASATVALIGFASKTSRAVISNQILAAVGPAVVIAIAIYLPLVLVSDPARWYREVVHYALFEFPEQRGVEFIRPTVRSIWTYLQNRMLFTFARTLLEALFLAAPFLLGPLALAVAVCVRVRNPVADQQSLRMLGQSVFLALTCLGLLNQMRVRPGAPQGFPATVISSSVASFRLGGTAEPLWPATKRSIDRSYLDVLCGAGIAAGRTFER